MEHSLASQASLFIALDFAAAIQKSVPYFPTKQWPVTVRQIAGHLGGIRTYDYANYDRYKNEFVNIGH